MHDATVHTAVVGLAWGDEGKGKIVDLLCGAFDVVVRYNGGANAGHTVNIAGKSYALHLLPAGLLRDHVRGVIGAGVVVDPAALIEELDLLAGEGIAATDRLQVSDRAHLVMPYHKVEDRARESSADGADRIGTTARGIGPCYADKALRSTALRAVDLLLLKTQRDRIQRIINQKCRLVAALQPTEPGVDPDEVWTLLTRAADRLGPLIGDTSARLLADADAGRKIFFEGANGMLLDLDQGTYPFVTSSHPGPSGIAAGAGVPPTLVGRVLGVTKAYSTRVGSGPFPTEQDNAVGDEIRTRGREFGTTTGRPRRCGWLDATAIRASVRQGGVTELAMTHLDTLGGIERVAVSTGYRLDGQPIPHLPADPTQLERVEPVLEWMPGWGGDLRQTLRYEDLPAAARAYIHRIESLVGAPVTIVSVGPERDQTILRAVKPAQTSVNA